MMKATSTERFGYEWGIYRNVLPEYEEQFKKWIFPLAIEQLKGKVILDAGCGMGRNSYWCLKYGAKKLVAFDFDIRTVNSAKRTLKGFLNARVEYRSIYDIDYKDKFDIVICIGVLHHLDRPKDAIKKLKSVLKQDGTLLVWVYGYENNERLILLLSLVKSLTSRLPIFFTHMIGFYASMPLFVYLRLASPRGEYLRLMKKFSFYHVHSIVFDQLLPRIARYYKKGQALDLLRDMQNVRISHTNNNSWTVVGQKA